MLILNVQHWEGDKNQAMELIQLMCDLEPEYRSDVTLLISSRFDCEPDWPQVDRAKKKFPVVLHKTRKTGIGWPQGPNDLFADSYEFCIESVRSGRIKAKAVLFIEADCVPVKINWINEIISEYESCGKPILGCLIGQQVCGIPHINGNFVMAIDFWKNHKAILQPIAGAWDALHAHFIVPNAHPARTIYSDYHLGTDRNPWKGCAHLFGEKEFIVDGGHPMYGHRFFPAWYHGPKDLRGIQCVRHRFLGGPEVADEPKKENPNDTPYQAFPQV